MSYESAEDRVKRLTAFSNRFTFDDSLETFQQINPNLNQACVELIRELRGIIRGGDYNYRDCETLYDKVDSIRKCDREKFEKTPDCYKVTNFMYLLRIAHLWKMNGFPMMIREIVGEIISETRRYANLRY